MRPRVFETGYLVSYDIFGTGIPIDLLRISQSNRLCLLASP